MSNNFITISKIENIVSQSAKRKRYIGLDKDGIERSINTEPWLQKEIGENLEIIESIENNRINVNLNDQNLTHPTFEIGESYKFILKEIRIKKDNVPYFVFIGIDENEYEVKKFDWMTSMIQEIGGEYNLTFEKILKGRVILKVKMFYELNSLENIIGIKEYFNNETFEDSKNFKLFKDQYNERHNNWILSFSSHLADCLFNARNRKDWLEFKKINFIQSEVEKWIITSGYLKLFKKIDSDKIKNRIIETRKTNNQIISIIELILNYKDDDYIINLNEEISEKEEFNLTFLNVFNQNLLENNRVVTKVFKFSCNLIFKKQHLSPFINSITSKIYFLNRSFRENNENYSIEIKKDKIIELLNLNIIVYNISLVNDLKIKPKLYLVKIINLINNLYPEISSKLLELKKKVFNDCIEYKVFTSVEIVNVLNQLQNFDKENIFKQKELKINSIHKVEIIGKLKNGYFVLLNEIYGILPLLYLHKSKIDKIKIGDKLELFLREFYSDINLIIFSSYKNNRIEDTTNVIVEQSQNSYISYLPEQFVTGKINKVVDYGVFISLDDKNNGLLHKKNIHPFFVERFKEYFKDENPIQVNIVSIDKFDKTISLSNYLILREFFSKLNTTNNCFIEILNYNSNLLSLFFDNSLFLPLKVNDIELDKKISFEDIHSFRSNVVFKDSIFYFSEITDIKYKDEYLLNDLKNIFNEISFTIEEIALSNDNFLKKIELLQLTKMLYGFSSNIRSYFIQNYIIYIKLLEEFTIRDNNKEIEDFIIEIEKNTQLTNTFKSFSFILNHLKLISCFEQINENSFHILVNFYFKDGYKNISKEIFKYNILNFEKDDLNYKNKIKKILSKEMIDQITTEVVFGDLDVNEKEIDSNLKEILNLISKGENSQVEFKETLTVPITDQSKISEKIENLNYIIQSNSIEKVQLDLKDKINEIQSTKSDVLIHSAFKNIVAFANTKGGDLFIGVDDKGMITGLTPDYSKLFKDIDPDDLFSLRDKFRLHLDNLINLWIDPEIRSLIDINILNYKNSDFCHISVQRKTTKNLLYLYYDIDKKTQNKIDSKTWYYRGVANARAYTAEELVSYYTNLMN
jgi:hypothetical protein